MSTGGSLSTKGVTRPGGTLGTKGIVDESGTATPTGAPGVSQEPLALSVSRGAVTIVIPTSTNVMLMAVENIVANLRVQQASNLQLPSLYKRAYLVAYETDEIAVVKSQV